ncbi:MAG: type II toxin-antitoxin system RelB/DinJ family antitoxin [Clostridia bacterium]|nr:type II toxin-antitoxin system RelB/DinJ family antitoxin [Clostridia bacterium]
MKSEKTNFTIRLDKSEKDAFTSICQELGINASTAITIFIKTVIRENRIPFTISLTRNN